MKQTKQNQRCDFHDSSNQKKYEKKKSKKIKFKY
jgi:hypothetical protein